MTNIRTQYQFNRKNQRKRRSTTDVEENVPLAKQRKHEINSFKIAVEDALLMKQDIGYIEAKNGKRFRANTKDQKDMYWKRWRLSKKVEEEGIKWTFLEHKGPVFAPPYERLPEGVTLRYEGRAVSLSPDAEEVASLYARLLDTEFTNKFLFNINFFNDWRKFMTPKEAEMITDFSKCDFRDIHNHFQNLMKTRIDSATRYNIKMKNMEIENEYGFCVIDGFKEKIGNFRIEPPGIFKGRGRHPKMGMVKKRVMPEDVIINCSEDSKIPVPPPGHHWKEVRHDNTVTWLDSWTDNISEKTKYVTLCHSSPLNSKRDWLKFENARKLQKHIDKIRQTYRKDWNDKDLCVRQRGVAVYLIDKLSLRAGNDKDDTRSDIAGCCTLRVKHLTLHAHRESNQHVVVLDFFGKDYIRYHNEVPVEPQVFANLEEFVAGKKPRDYVFDKLNTQTLNNHLRQMMPGLTAKVFRTYNASMTLQQNLDELTDPSASLEDKILAYQRANRAAARLCNHHRAIPKDHAKTVENLNNKIQRKLQQQNEIKKSLKRVKEKRVRQKKEKLLNRLSQQIKQLKRKQTERDENKTLALNTSKLNYLDPRITVAWCKKHGIPIDKVLSKKLQEKFRWAINMAGPHFRF